jgi:hypothetical protein
MFAASFERESLAVCTNISVGFGVMIGKQLTIGAI